MRARAAAGVGEILYKDEAERFGLGSFKALGGAYAVFKLLRQCIRASDQALQPTVARSDVGPLPADLTSRITVTCATDGNHGRSVAWGARTFGCRCVIYVHETVSEGRCRAIAAYGAEVRRVPGTYDDAVRRAACGRGGARLDTWSPTPPTKATPSAARRDAGLQPDGPRRRLEQAAVIPTHVFVQGGVGGLAAGVCSYLWETMRRRPSTLCRRRARRRPTVSIAAPSPGKPTPAEGTLDTIMAGLACGEVSILAWQHSGSRRRRLHDDRRRSGRRLHALLADGRFGDRAGGGRRIGGRRAGGPAARERQRRCAPRPRSAARQPSSGVRHEGATDPDVYRTIVGALRRTTSCRRRSDMTEQRPVSDLSRERYAATSTPRARS